MSSEDIVSSRFIMYHKGKLLFRINGPRLYRVRFIVQIKVRDKVRLMARVSKVLRS